ncbi:hypothetical protein IKD82_02535 [Candidatus Saccharibacteria bacterium]|nr:hypothetical protein [Candidatus Saccharibacteria bacterium]
MSGDEKFDYLLKEIRAFCDNVQVDFTKKLFDIAEPDIQPKISDLNTTCMAFDLLLIFCRLNFFRQIDAEDLKKFIDQIHETVPLSKEQIISLCDRLGANENAMLNELGYFAYGGVLIDVFFCVYDCLVPEERKCKNLTDGEGIAEREFNVPKIHTAALSFELAPMFMDMGHDCDKIRKEYLDYDK